MPQVLEVKTFYVAFGDRAIAVRARSAAEAMDRLDVRKLLAQGAPLGWRERLRSRFGR